MAKTPTIPAKQARGELRWIANSLRGLIALDEQLGDCADIEELIAQHKATITAQEATIAGHANAISAAADVAKVKLASVKAETDEIIAAARDTEDAADARVQEANALVEHAKVDATGIIDRANKTGEAIVNDAKAYVASLATLTEEKLLALATVNNRLADATALLAEANSQRAALAQKLA